MKNIKYHKTLKINLLSTNFDDNIEKFESNIIMTNKKIFKEMFVEKLKKFNYDYYDTLIEVINEYQLSVEDIKLIIKNEYIEKSAIKQLWEIVSDKNLLNKKNMKKSKDLF